MATKSRSTAKNPNNPETPAAAITVQRTAKCRTLGNGSQLTYDIGTDAEGQAHIRLTAAAGGGFFSSEWISLNAILAALDAWPTDRPLTSYALAPLFRGKSANNPAFLAAVLVAEGVLRKQEGRKRRLERCEPTDPNGGFGVSGVVCGPAAKKKRSSRRQPHPDGAQPGSTQPTETPTTPKPRASPSRSRKKS